MQDINIDQSFSRIFMYLIGNECTTMRYEISAILNYYQHHIIGPTVLHFTMKVIFAVVLHWFGCLSANLDCCGVFLIGCVLEDVESSVHFF